MIVRFGYVAMSMELENASPSKTVTLKNFNKIAEKDREAALAKVTRVAQENLQNTLRLLRNNKANKVMVYRFSSKLIPLATHPDLRDWDYLGVLEPYFKEIGNYVKANGFRVSFHPDHYTLINSPREEVLKTSLRDLRHHHDMLTAMGLGCEAKLVTHVGGAYKDKTMSLKRYIENWPMVSQPIKDRLCIENDDKTYTVTEVLGLCKEIRVPMILDLHHFYCNHSDGENLTELFPSIVDTWKDTDLNPKLHISSPKSEKDFRSHHDFVKPEDILPFLKSVKGSGIDIDVMVEAKQKDKAMLKLVDDLEETGEVKRLNNASIEM